MISKNAVKMFHTPKIIGPNLKSTVCTFLGCFETFYTCNIFYFNSKIGFIDMFLRLQNEIKIAKFLTEKFFESKRNLTNRALVSLKYGCLCGFSADRQIWPPPHLSFINGQPITGAGSKAWCRKNI